MLVVIPFLLFASVLVDAAPFERRDTSNIITNCNHDFAYTWDDGPYKNHDKINDIFTSASSHTTFYINGNNWSCIYDEDNVQALRASYEAGHQLAHHTWSHPDLKTLSNAQIDVEIGRLNDAFIRILGVKPKFFRPPYGSVTEQIAAYIQNKFGLIVVTWSDDSLDSDGKDTEQWNYDYYTGLAAGGNGSPHITLSHETILGSVEALGNGTVTNLKAANFNLVTTATCLDEEPYETVTGYYGTRDSSWTCAGTWVPGNFPGQPSSSSSSSSSSSTVSTTTTTTTTTPPTTSSTTTGATPTTTCQWYSPSSPTTCDAVGAANGVSGTAIKAANSFVNCDDIWSGTWLCIPSGTPTTSTPPSSTSSSVSPTCTSWYASTSATTCDAVGAMYGVPGATIQALNSFVNCADIWPNTQLCVPSNSPITAAPPPPTASCASTYSSLSGDTCSSIETKFGLISGAIQQANSFVTCTDIWVGTPLCIPPGSPPTSGGQCTRTISSTAGATCDSIGAANGISGAQIESWNDFLNCSDIWTNTPVCVAH